MQAHGEPGAHLTPTSLHKAPPVLNQPKEFEICLRNVVTAAPALSWENEMITESFVQRSASTSIVTQDSAIPARPRPNPKAPDRHTQ